MTDHPNLSPAINKAIANSEKAGGFWLKDLHEGQELKVQTRNTSYHVKLDPSRPGAFLIKGHTRYCPDWTEANIHGSTWGGSMLKMRFIGRGMHMDYSIVGEARQEQGLPFHAQVQDVYLVDPESGSRVQ